MQHLLHSAIVSMLFPVVPDIKPLLAGSMLRKHRGHVQIILAFSSGKEEAATGVKSSIQQELKA